MGIEGQQSFRLFWIATGSGLPFQQAAAVIQFSEGIHIGYEVIASWERTRKLDLQVAPGLANADATVLTEAVEQLQALLQHAVPAVPLGVVQRLILINGPFSMESGGCIFTPEICSQCLLEGSAEEHGCAGVFLLPTIQIAMTIATWAGQILADLGIAVGHDAALPSLI